MPHFFFLFFYSENPYLSFKGQRVVGWVKLVQKENKKDFSKYKGVDRER